MPNERELEYPSPTIFYASLHCVFTFTLKTPRVFVYTVYTVIIIC